jgi:hypothetical protein
MPDLQQRRSRENALPQVPRNSFAQSRFASARVEKRTRQEGDLDYPLSRRCRRYSSRVPPSLPSPTSAGTGAA